MSASPTTDSTTDPTADPAADIAPADRRRAVTAASVGTFVEYYDFAVYGYVAVFMAHAFFPEQSPLAGLLLTFGLFAASYVARPLGAVVFAPLGDRFGRRTVLAVVILLMTAATAGIGLLPTYAQIGIAAPMLLTVLRVVQGVSAGGEYGGAVSLIAEYAPARRRAFHVAFVSLTIGLALLVGSGLSLVLASSLGTEAMQAWGWRVPLLLALPLGLVGLIIRYRLDETPAFRSLRRRGEVQRSPLLTVLRRDHRQVLLGIGIAATNAAMMATLFIYLPSALRQFSGLGSAAAQLVTFVGLILYCLCVLPLAIVADRVGRKRMVTVSAAALVLALVPGFLIFSLGSLGAAVAAMVVLAPLVAANVAAVTPMLAELFGTDTRFTGLSLGWQLSTTAFAGPTPVVLAAIAGAAGPVAPGWYVTAVVALTVVAGLLLPRSARS